MNNSFGKQLKMKPYELFLFLLLMIIDVSTNAQEVTCEGEQLINVDILFGNASIVSPYKPGHILVFRCTDEKQKMRGHRAIECQSDGKWDYPYPTCIEVTCEGEQLINVDILFGHPGIVSPYKPGHILVFRCTDVNLKLNGHRAIECQSDGKWDQPYPTCREVTCVGKQLLNVEILFGNASIGSPYKPGHILVFRCTDEKQKMRGHQAIECQSDGKWDYPYPTCIEVTCEGEQLFNVDILIGHPSIISPYKPGHILVFRCTDEKQKMHGQRTIECQSDGKWNHPYPTCREIACKGEQLINVDILIGYPGIVSPYKPGHILVFQCTDEKQKMHGQRTIECQSDGKWNHPYPTCRGRGKCGPPPPVNDGDTTDIMKKEYNTGERVEYICFSKYTMDVRYPFSRYLTCVQEEWSGNVKCLKPCTVTVEIMNERGIELAFADQQKLFAPHDDHVTFKCQSGKRPVGVDFRQKCNDGEMTLPECV
ncbi:E-selectin-like [Carassius carassius]|uniref:E-selectin-like n=1 Tax=Carassius carassius TaxID=217509 RepID=UPI002868C531|nr:E-selectin-like [Carassius carassius]XP_059425630.1 E-selectin-like [Carassius carassius]